MIECPECHKELEGPLPHLSEEFYLCISCRATYKMEEDHTLSWIPPMVIVTKGLSEIALAMSEISPDPDHKRTFQRQAKQFEVLSRIVR